MMPQTTITYRGTRAEFTAMLQRLPAILAGKEADPTGLVAELQRQMGQALLRKIRDSYLDRSMGFADEDGLPAWPPLSPVTIKKKGHDTILVERGDTLRSLDPDTPSPDQVLRVGTGFLEVGSKTETETGHNILVLHARGGRRLPKRPVMPEKVPDSWYRAMGAALLKGVMERGFWMRFFGGKAA